MNNQQFIYWLGGFVDAVDKEGPTPKQWETIVSELNNIKEPISFPIGGNGWGVPNTTPIQTLPFIQPADPYNPYKITSESDTTLTVSTGSSGTIIATPGYGSITYNPSTSTTYGYPSGSAWSYTNNTTLPKDTNVSYTANLPEEL
jgi:hypothetical protein